MLKKLMLVLDIMWETFKSFLIAVLIACAIVFAASSIIHNVFKIREIYAEDVTGYKNLVSVDDNRMNIRVDGEGEQTVVILSELGEPSPIIKYKTYSDELVSNNYRVATVEYFGYGYSLSCKQDRTNAEFAQEIKSALTTAEVPGPYIFVATGTSSMYAYTYSNLYPEDIQKLVVIDGIYPNSLNDAGAKKHIEDMMTNYKITFYAEFTGYARILSYIKPDIFHIDQMKTIGYDPLDIKTYRKMIANRYYTGTMKKEVSELENNMRDLQGYVYPDYLPVTQILSSGYVDEVKQLVKDKKTKTELEKYAKDMITNSSIQTVQTIKGSRSNLSFDNASEVVQAIMN